MLTVPKGFSIDSFVPSPGWTRVLQQTGSGDSAVIQKVTWTGGNIPSGEDSLFQFLGEPAKNGTYTFHGPADLLGRLDRRTGPTPETGADPAPTIEAKSSLGGGGTSTLTIVALVVGAVGVCSVRIALIAVAAAAAAAEAARVTTQRGGVVLALAVVAVALLLPAAASAHAYLIKTVPSASGDRGHARPRRSP